MNNPINYLEELPEGCPNIALAKDDDINIAYRLLRSEHITSECFMSHDQIRINQGLEVKRRCNYSSCSFFTDLEQAKVTAKAVKKAERKFSHYVQLKIPKGSGMHLTGMKSHIDFWAYSHCQFTQLCVTPASPLEEGYNENQ